MIRYDIIGAKERSGYYTVTLYLYDTDTDTLKRLGRIVRGQNITRQQAITYIENNLQSLFDDNKAVEITGDAKTKFIAKRRIDNHITTLEALNPTNQAQALQAILDLRDATLDILRLLQNGME